MLWAPTAPAQLAGAGWAVLDRAGLPDAASWWAQGGRALWQPEVAAGLAPPASFAGLVRGGWRLDEPGRPPVALPWPGVVQARAPLAWYDSLDCTGGGAADGWDAAVAPVAGGSPAGEGRALSAFTMGSGSTGLDEAAVTLSRSDSLYGLGLDAMNGTRGAGGGVERMGRHAWGARLRLARGAHRFGGALGQRGAAGRLAGGEEQAVRGQSGSAAWAWERNGLRWAADFARGLDRHESFGSLVYSERSAQETRLGAGFGLARDARELEARVSWSRAEVRRSGARASGARADAVWAVAGGAAPLAGGRLALALGAGHHGGVDRFEVAPSAEFTRPVGRLAAALRVERLLTPVWSDLAAGHEPFLQHAWVGSARLAAGGAGPWRARAGVRGGRVYSRAVADRLPLEEMWLRNGLRAEYGTYDFGLAEAGIERAGRRLDAGLEGFGLAHRSRPWAAADLPGGRAIRFDPDAGFRAWLGGRARFFRGDLGLGLRGEAEGVAAREGGTSTPWRLPAYVSFSLLGEASIGDVVVVWRLRNLEDRARAGTWTDRSTGLPVVEGRRELQMRLVWRLFN